MQTISPPPPQRLYQKVAQPITTTTPRRRHYLAACYTATTATAYATEFKNRQCASRPLFWPGTVCWVEASTQVRAPERGPYSATGRPSARPLDESDASTNPLSWPLPNPGHAELPHLNHSPTLSLQRSKNDARGSRDVATENEHTLHPAAAGRHAHATPKRRRTDRRRASRGTAPGRRTLTVLYIRD